MMIRDAELAFGQQRADIRVEAGVITAIVPKLRRRRGEEVVPAEGRALLPSLCDHHIHLQATAAARASVDCSPAACANGAALARALQAAEQQLEAGAWMRGIGFHDSVFAGEGQSLTRQWLDRVMPDRPVRIQHRSGRLWVLNSAALRALDVDPQHVRAPLECDDKGAATGRLYDGDAWLRSRMTSARPSLRALSADLWVHGITAVTDCSHSNDAEDFAHFYAAQAEGELLQDLLVMGGSDLDRRLDTGNERIAVGARKFHLHDHALPDYGAFKAQIRAAHAVGRNVAFHCVSRVDITFALAALRETGVMAGDRIEHASVTSPEIVAELTALGVTVVTQPAMIAERGDDYLREVETEEIPFLYRLASLCGAGIDVALSSDAPYTDINPWRCMQAAVDRRTAKGVVMAAAEEGLTPEHAYNAMSGPLLAPGRPRTLAEGARADMLLLDTDWAGARSNLARIQPRFVWRDGATTIT